MAHKLTYSFVYVYIMSKISKVKVKVWKIDPSEGLERLRVSLG
jgi:hypothetical protein